MAGDSFTGGRLSAIAGASSGCAGADLARGDLAVPSFAAGALPGVLLGVLLGILAGVALPPLMARNDGGGAAVRPAGLPAVFNLSALAMVRRPFLRSPPGPQITWFSALKIRPQNAH